jgi:ketosteroid isomerase-like protein
MDDTARRDELRRLFEELITAYGRKDFDAFAHFVHPDALFEWPYLPLKQFPTEMRGRDAFIETSRAGMANSDGYNHKIDAFYDQLDPDMLIVEYHSDSVVKPSGDRYANKYLGILRFSGDQVIFWKEYVNPLPILEVYGEFVNDAAQL